MDFASVGVYNLSVSSSDGGLRIALAALKAGYAAIEKPTDVKMIAIPKKVRVRRSREGFGGESGGRVAVSG